MCSGPSRAHIGKLGWRVIALQPKDAVGNRGDLDRFDTYAAQVVHGRQPSDPPILFSLMSCSSGDGNYENHVCALRFSESRQ